MGLWCFFFQAEDGIRDLVRSRGLGDVYKRQEIRRAHGAQLVGVVQRNGLEGSAVKGEGRVGQVPVSYTHLTLPTSDLV